MPIRHVIDNLVKHQTIFQSLHNKSKHKRQKSIYCQVANKYW